MNKNNNLATYILLAFAVLLSVTGCMTEGKFARQMVRGHVRYEPVTAKYCSMWFPIRTKDSTVIEYRQGARIPVPGPVRYIEVNCDSLLQATSSNRTYHAGSKSKQTFTVGCPPCYDTIQVDTLLQLRSQIQESTATVEHEKNERKKERDAKDKEINDLTGKNGKLQGTNKLLWWGVGLLGAYTLARWLLRWFTKGRIKLP